MATDRDPASLPRTYIVLCVDDHVPGLVTRKAFLESVGYTVQTVTNGPAALSLVQQIPPDVVLLDYRMPGMDGLEVLERLHRSRPELPVIVLTGYPREVPKRLEELAYACLTKGGAPTRLLEVLHDALGSVPSKPASIAMDRLPPSASDDIRAHLLASQRHAKEAKEMTEAVQRRLSGQRGPKRP